MVALAKGETIGHASTVEALGIFGLGRSLRRLFADHGMTPEAVAAALPFPVDPALFYRVDSGRQPLPADVAEAVARVLVRDFAGNPASVDVGTVNGAARLVTRARGEYVRRPLPPLPIANPSALFGEVYQPPELSPYRVTHPLGGNVQLWVFGQSTGEVVGAMFAEANRAGTLVSGLLPGPVNYGLAAIVPSAYDGLRAWTAGPSATAGKFWIHNFATSPPAANAHNNAAAVPGGAPQPVWPFSLAWEPATARLWFADFNNGRAHRIDPATLVADLSVDLAIGGNAYSGTGLVAVGGKLYAVGVHNPGAPGEDGRLFEIDPVAGSVLRTSSGANLGFSGSLDYDADSATFFVSGVAGNAYAGGSLCAVQRASFVATSLAVVPLPAPAPNPMTTGGFYYVTVAYGSLWLTGGGSALWNLDFAGRVRRWFQPTPVGTATGCRVASDGQGFLWFPDGQGTLYLVSPADPGPELARCATLFAAAGGALMVREGVAPALVP